MKWIFFILNKKVFSGSLPFHLHLQVQRKLLQSQKLSRSKNITNPQNKRERQVLQIWKHTAARGRNAAHSLCNRKKLAKFKLGILLVFQDCRLPRVALCISGGTWPEYACNTFLFVCFCLKWYSKYLRHRKWDFLCCCRATNPWNILVCLWWICIGFTVWIELLV